jgi:regulator of replication initiation timing
LLATFNSKGEIQGVKYDRIGVVLVNAVKEQQTQIESQKKQIEELQEQNRQQRLFNDGLRKLVCSQNPQAEICGEPQK